MPSRARCSEMKVAVVVIALAGVAHADKWIDRPAWPVKLPATATLRWVVHPYQGGGDGVMPKRPTSLEIVVGDVTRKLDLAPQDGELKQAYLPLCGGTGFPLAKGEVAKITFDNAGDGGFVIRRTGDVLAIIGWELSDGACPGPRGEARACPRRDKLVARLHLPAKLKLTEELVEVDAHGARTPFACDKLR